MPSLCRRAGPLGLDCRDRRPPTCCRPCVRQGDGPALAFLSTERPLARLLQGHLPSAGLGSLDPSGGWREERRLLAPRSCALERRAAATRAMLLVLRAISLRASAARLGLPIRRPAGEPSLETRPFRLRELGSCRRPAGGQTSGPRLGPQEQTRGRRLKAAVYLKGKAALGGGRRPGKAREAAGPRPRTSRGAGSTQAARLRTEGSACSRAGSSVMDGGSPAPRHGPATTHGQGCPRHGHPDADGRGGGYLRRVLFLEALSGTAPPGPAALLGGAPPWSPALAGTRTPTSGAGGVSRTQRGVGGRSKAWVPGSFEGMAFDDLRPSLWRAGGHQQSHCRAPRASAEPGEPQPGPPAAAAGVRARGLRHAAVLGARTPPPCGHLPGPSWTWSRVCVGSCRTGPCPDHTCTPMGDTPKEHADVPRGLPATRCGGNGA